MLTQQSGEQLENVQAHEADLQINDIQFSADRTYFITASRDKTAKVSLWFYNYDTLYNH